MNNERKERVLKKRFVIFCEGDTEYNYINCMRRNQGVELVLKPVNMGGGGYASFLRKIKTEPQSNCLAKFIIVDADRFIKIQGELPHFNRLADYCAIQNRKGSIPHFLIVDNPDFEYVACLHSPDYRGQDIHRFLKDVFGLKDIDEFKGNERVYDILNRAPLGVKVMLDALKGREKILKNVYEIKKKTFDITIRKTIVNPDAVSQKCSNIEELFDIIDW